MKYCSFLIAFLLSQSIKGQTTSSPADRSNKDAFIHFTPVSFSNKFSLNVNPVLTIKSGDTVSTETIDADGVDKNGVRRCDGGNPLTGPFYIKDALPGDVLAISLNKVSLNRSHAFTTQRFVSRSLPISITDMFKSAYLVKWKLDFKNGVASPDSIYWELPTDSVYEKLRNFKVPLQPFLGCIGVAPLNEKNEILSFYQGTYGGNLDFNRIAQSAIIYLPVFHAGAYLYIGDGHAIQGDGEIAGNAVETSLDVEFSVKLIKKEVLHIKYPLVEDSIYIMAIGSAKTLDDALKISTSGLLEWLRRGYHISLLEATQVMSTTIEYTIAEIADPEVIIVAKIKKEILKGLKKSN
jgi:acetamidase/formamidase